MTIIMGKPPIPPNEEARLKALCGLQILDTAPEDRFDDLTMAAKLIFDVPIALISLVDSQRQWFKSRQGLDATETPRDISFCGHAICQENVFVVEDAAKHEKFCDNPLVCGFPNIRFYAGYPISVPTGEKIGTLCVIDTVPREMSDKDKNVLRHLGMMTEKEIAMLSAKIIMSKLEKIKSDVQLLDENIKSVRKSLRKKKK